MRTLVGKIGAIGVCCMCLSSSAPLLAQDPDEPELIIAEEPCTDRLFFNAADWTGTQAPPTSLCSTYRVRCSGGVLPNRLAEVRRTIPADGIEAGSIVFVGGGLGTSWWGNKRADENPNPLVEELARVARDKVMVPLLDDGYQMLEYRWIQDGGWLESISNNGDPADENAWLGLKAASCRPGNLIRRLRELFDPDPTGDVFPFCATGQSGGAVQLAYSLTYQNGQSYLDSVVLTSGPTFTDIAFGCQEIGACSPPNPHPGCYGGEQECFIDQAYGNDEPHVDCRTPAMSVGPCETPNGDEPAWLDQANLDGLVPNPTDMNDEPDHTYPFGVHFVFGQTDLGEAPPQGLKYRQALWDGGVNPLTETSCKSLVGVPHGVPWGDADDDPLFEGPLEVLTKLQTYCVESPQDVPAGEDDVDCSLHHPNPVP
jgi:hypothetical protein